MDKVIWKSIKGYEGLYEVSNRGEVKRLARLDSLGKSLKEKILKPWVNRGGYLVVKLYNNSKKNKDIHRLVAEAFLEPSDGKIFVNHKNGIKTDNNLENLEWVSPRQNNLHAYENDLIPKGDKHHWSKINEDTVISILNSNDTITCLSKKFNISDSHVRSIKKGKVWRHVYKKWKEVQNGR